MSVLDQLTPTQRNVALFGIPVVGIAVIVASRRPAPAEEPAPPVADAPAGTVDGYMPDTGVIDTGTLSSWGSQFTEAITGLAGRIDDLEARPTTTPTTGATGNPLAPTLQGSKLGRRQTTSRAIQPPGRGFPGETMSEISRRVYGDRGYANYVRFFNPKAWPGSPDKAVKAGTVIYY